MAPSPAHTLPVRQWCPHHACFELWKQIKFSPFGKAPLTFYHGRSPTAIIAENPNGPLGESPGQETRLERGQLAEKVLGLRILLFDLNDCDR